MTILGIIAATMITTLKPSQYKQQGFDTQKRKMYSEIDNILLTIIEECSADTSLRTLYENCNRTTTPFAVEVNTRTKFSQLFNTYVKGTYYPKDQERDICTQNTTYVPTIKLKNGTCLYFSINAIKVDVNGDEGPNELGVDQYYHVYNRKSGDSSLEDMETAISYAQGQTCSGTPTCTCNVNGAIQNVTPSKKNITKCATTCSDAGGYLENYSCS